MYEAKRALNMYIEFLMCKFFKLSSKYMLALAMYKKVKKAYIRGETTVKDIVTSYVTREEY